MSHARGDMRSSVHLVTPRSLHRRVPKPHMIAPGPPSPRSRAENSQVKMVLIPKRDEFNETERGKMWWCRDDYSRFRQVLIDWKRRNAHRISHTDNILSIDLTDIDEEDVLEETVAGPGATAAAAASAAAAAAAAMAAATVASAAAATAAAAAAATAAEVAVSHAQEGARGPAPAPCAAQDSGAGAAEAPDRGATFPPVKPAPVPEESSLDEDVGALPVEADEGVGDEEAPEREAHEHRQRATASAALANQAAECQEVESPPMEAAGGEGREVEPKTAEAASVGGKRVRARRSFSRGSGGGGGDRSMPCWSLGGPGGGRLPLRRSFSINEVSTTSSVARLKEVPLSEKQATIESLRTWRESLDHRFARPSAQDLDDRGRSVSLQHPKAVSPRGSGRETAVLLVEHGSSDARYTVKEDAGTSSESTQDLALSVQPENGKHPSISLIMVAFERARKEELARQAEAEAERVAEAAAMVEAAAVAAAAAAGEPERRSSVKSPLGVQNGQSREGASSSERMEDQACGESRVIELGLNDSPEPAAAVAAMGIRMAVEGVSNLSLRARDSVENLQVRRRRAGFAKGTLWWRSLESRM